MFPIFVVNSLPLWVTLFLLCMFLTKRRMVVLNIGRKVLQYRIISKDNRFRGKVVLIPRIRLSPNVETLPVLLKRLHVTNFIRLYLHQFFGNSHGLNGYRKPLKRPFDQCQSRLEAINISQDIRQINW